jgi:uncharacterized protein YndB with AHSA1/START domain
VITETVTHEIAGCAEEVWALVADPSRWPSWRSTVSHAALLDGGPGTSGARYRQRSMIAYSAKDVVVTVVSVEPPTCISLSTDGYGARFEERFGMAGTPGGAVVTIEASIDVPRPMASLVGPQIRRTLQADLRALDRFLA